VLHKDIANGCEKFPLEVRNIVNAFNIDINLKYITKCRAKDEGLRAKVSFLDLAYYIENYIHFLAQLL
jgi:hypothetical protein